MTVTTRVEGFRELERELERIGTPAARKASARRAMVTAVAPMAEMAKANAPRAEGNLADNIVIGTRVSGGSVGGRAFAQAMRSGATRVEAVQAMRDAQRETASMAVVHMGPGRHPQAITQEFGTRHHAAQPYMRPAWDAESQPTLDRIKQELWADIERTVARAARRAARQAARG
jgi:HK97 gp10 family phage protein